MTNTEFVEMVEKVEGVTRWEFTYSTRLFARHLKFASTSLGWALPKSSDEKANEWMEFWAV